MCEIDFWGKLDYTPGIAQNTIKAIVAAHDIASRTFRMWVYYESTTETDTFISYGFRPRLLQMISLGATSVYLPPVMCC